jgi:hypothetical protein
MSEIVVVSNTGPLVSAFQCGRIGAEAEMSKIYQVKPHEPEEELLSAEDAWEDFLSLRQALDGRQISRVTFQIDRATWTLMRELIAAGVAQDEDEVISKAVQKLYTTVYPRARQGVIALHEAGPDEP